MDPKVRAFYIRHASETSVGPALWAIFDDYPQPDGWAYGRLVRMWEDDHGYIPAIELVPRIN